MTYISLFQDFPEANIPKVVRSFFENPGGVKFTHFMWILSMFAVQLTLQAEKSKLANNWFILLSSYELLVVNIPTQGTM